MITGQQLRRARERRGWTQEELAAQLGVTFRSVGNWERGEVPANRQERIRHVLGGDLEEDPNQSGNPLASYSNLALANELLRRLEMTERREPSDDRQSEAKKSDGDDPAPKPLGEALEALSEGGEVFEFPTSPPPGWLEKQAARSEDAKRHPKGPGD